MERKSLDDSNIISIDFTVRKSRDVLITIILLFIGFILLFYYLNWGAPLK